MKLDKQLESILGANKETAEQFLIRPQRFLSTGFNALDYDVLRTGGIPSGKVTHIWGPKTSFKSALTRALLKKAQDDDPSKLQFYYSTEWDLVERQMLDAGVDLSRVVLIQDNVAEVALKRMTDLINTGRFNFGAIDSLAALEALKSGEGDKSPALQARAIKDAIPALGKAIALHDIYFVATNQVRINIGVKYGDPEMFPGGNAFKHLIHVSLKMSFRGWLPDNKAEDKTGGLVRVRSDYNKFAPGGGTTDANDLKIWFDNSAGLGEKMDLYDRAVRAEIIGNSGAGKANAVFGYDKTLIKKWSSKDTCRAAIFDNEDGILDTIKELLNDKATIPPGVDEVSTSYQLPDEEED
jgi:recombination protein RecA